MATVSWETPRAAAMVAQRADFVLMPCRPALFDLDAIASTVKIVTSAEASAAVVLNAAPRGKLADEESAKTWGELGHQGLFRPRDDWQTAAVSGHRE